MIHAYLCNIIGTGLGEDAFRPAVANFSDNYGMIDLRANTLLPVGAGIAWTIGRNPVAGPGILSLETEPRNKLNSRLGMSLSRGSFAELIHEILTVGVVGRADLCPPLARELDGKRRIYFGGRRLTGSQRPDVRGGTITDDFNRASLGSNWSQSESGAFTIVSNEVHTQSINGNPHFPIMSYSAANMASENHYSQITQTGGSGASQIICPAVRVTPGISSAADYYMGYVNSASSGSRGLGKVTNGALTNLASDTWTPTGSPYTIKLTAIGSSLELFLDGVSILTATDTTYPSQLVVGVACHPNPTYSSYGDDWEASEISLLSCNRTERLDRFADRIERL